MTTLLCFCYHTAAVSFVCSSPLACTAGMGTLAIIIIIFINMRRLFFKRDLRISTEHLLKRSTLIPFLVALILHPPPLAIMFCILCLNNGMTCGGPTDRCGGKLSTTSNVICRRQPTTTAVAIKRHTVEFHHSTEWNSPPTRRLPLKTERQATDNDYAPLHLKRNFWHLPQRYSQNSECDQRLLCFRRIII